MKKDELGVRLEILKAAGSLFRQYGYHKTTLDDIASEINKKKSAIYYYFGNKEAIFKAVVEQEAAMVGKHIEDAINNAKNAEEKLIIYVKERNKQFREKINYYHALKSEYLNFMTSAEKIRKIYIAEEKEIISQILRSGVESEEFEIEDVDLATKALALVLESLELPVLINEEDSDKKDLELEYLIEVLLYGITKR